MLRYTTYMLYYMLYYAHVILHHKIASLGVAVAKLSTIERVSSYAQATQDIHHGAFHAETEQET